MICPYIQANETYVEQLVKDFDEANNNTFLEDKRLSTQTMFECQQTNCAVWRKDEDDAEARCHYNG